MDEGLSQYVRAYQLLSTCRSIGYGVIGPIWWTAVDTWCTRHRMDDDVRAQMFDVIALVDGETLRRNAGEAKKTR